MKVKSKFEIKDTRKFSEKAKSCIQSAMFWMGRKKGMIHTRTIRFDDLRYIFFPKGFEKYGYLGTQLWNEDGSYFKALYPLVLALDYAAKPKLCPRWFLRFLHVFGMDKSIVRVRNRRLSNLLSTLTKGIGFIDYKTKWYDYDLRISIHAPKHLQDLSNDIEHGFYSRGRQEELVEQIKAIDPEANPIWGNISRLEKELEKLENKILVECDISDGSGVELDIEEI